MVLKDNKKKSSDAADKKKSFDNKKEGAAKNGREGRGERKPADDKFAGKKRTFTKREDGNKKEYKGKKPLKTYKTGLGEESVPDQDRKRDFKAKGKGNYYRVVYQV